MQPLVGVSAFDAASVTLRLTGEVVASEREARELHLKERLLERFQEVGITLV
jgi:hypothetical protein